MNCLSEDKIQMYIDNELDDTELKLIQQHITVCCDCAELAEEKAALKNQLKTVWKINNDDSIPEFNYPDATITKASWKKQLWASSAAAIILILFVLSPANKTKPEYDYMNYQSIDFEIDANQPITEMEMVMNVIDTEGNVTEYFFE